MEPRIPILEDTKQTMLYDWVLNSSIILIAKSSLLPVWWQQNVCMVGSDIFMVLSNSKNTTIPYVSCMGSKE